MFHSQRYIAIENSSSIQDVVLTNQSNTYNEQDQQQTSYGMMNTLVDHSIVYSTDVRNE
jgi:hypothetical protein